MGCADEKRRARARETRHRERSTEWHGREHIYKEEMWEANLVTKSGDRID